MIEVNENSNVIDSRDVIERIAELEEIEADSEELDEDDARELRDLRELAKEGRNLSDWEHGATLIRDSYFVEYAEELASDIGAISKDAQWPLRHIDWDAAAEELKIDYTTVDFNGVTYWSR